MNSCSLSLGPPVTPKDGAHPRHVTSRVFAFTSRAADSMISGVVIADGVALLIDPGVLPHEIEQIAEFIEDRGASVDFILLTHHHRDHVLATSRWPKARRLAHPELEGIVLTQQRDPEYAEMLRKACAAHDSPVHTDWRLMGISDPLKEGQVLELGPIRCEVLLLPGHAPDAIGLLLRSERVLFTADMLDPNEPPLPEHDPEKYRASLDRIADLVARGTVEQVVPGHGWPLTTPSEILTQLTKDRALLQARPEGRAP